MNARAAEIVGDAAEAAADELIAGYLAEHQPAAPAVPAAGWLPTTSPSAIPVWGW